MALYIDIHARVRGLSAEDVARAHLGNRELHANYGVIYQRHWFDEDSGRAVCLIEAPSREAAAAMHQEVLGLGVDQIIELRDKAWVLGRSAC